MGILSQSAAVRCAGSRSEAAELLSKGMAREAAMMLADLVDANPFDSALCADLGKAVLVLGMTDQAIVAARRAVELDAANVEAFVLLSLALESQGEVADAYQALRRAFDMARNPLPPVPDFCTREAPMPLTLSEFTAVFLDFELVGDCANLSLRSKTGDGRHVLQILVRGALPPLDGAGFEVASRGRFPRERVLDSLPEKIATAVRLFPAEQFDYTLHKKN
jgi:tetratricopeptide (TPR) repeat protein